MGNTEKRIEVCQVRAGDINTDFGNPRKVSKAKLEELRESMETLGDFGVYLIDENNSIIGGNQRLKVVKEAFGEDVLLDCKRLIGYTKSEKRAINLKDNTHAGEWDLDMLADWTADLNLGVELEDPKKADDNHDIPEMELIHYEKYNYVMIVCNNELDYNNLVRALGIEGAMVKISKRKIKARAIWYHKMKAKVVPFDELPDYMRDDSDVRVEDDKEDEE